MKICGGAKKYSKVLSISLGVITLMLFMAYQYSKKDNNQENLQNISSHDETDNFKEEKYAENTEENNEKMISQEKAISQEEATSIALEQSENATVTASIEKSSSGKDYYIVILEENGVETFVYVDSLTGEILYKTTN